MGLQAAVEAEGVSQTNYPDFWPGFACKGGACRRTCCRHDWNVVMSRREYEAATNPAAGLPEGLRSLAEACVRPNPRAEGDADFAHVEMVGDVDCPMLDADGRCRWRALAGRHICSTCENFPCTTMSYRGREYLMPSCGCEAVVEALLHRETPIRMAGGPAAAPGRSYNVHITEGLVASRPLLGHYPLLVEFGLAVLQDRALPLDERMARLMEAMAQVDRMECAGMLDRLPAFLEGFAAHAATGGAADGTAVGKVNGTGAARDRGTSPGGAPWLAVFVCGEMFSHYCHSSAHEGTARRIVEGLGIALREARDEDGTRHCLPVLASRDVYPAKRAAFGAFLSKRETFLEHVMASLYLKMLMPVREPGVWAHAMYFAAVYAAVKGGLIGFFAPDEPTDEALVDVLVEIVRMATHSELMYPTVCRRVRSAGVDTLQGLQALVRA